MTLLALENSLNYPRLGLAIGRKIVRRAVMRNRIKRQLRESFRLHRAAIGNLDIIILLRAGSGEITQQQLRHSIDSLWSKLAKRCAPF